MRWLWLALVLTQAATGLDEAALAQRTREYLTGMVRIDSTNPPGNETRVAEYLKGIADAEGIPCQVIGSDAGRMNFVARLAGSGEQRPLLLMAHTDVVPADASQWTLKPFAAEVLNGRLYGRGAEDDKNLLAAEMAVLVELKRQGTRLRRDVIVLAEADEEAGSTGIQWMIGNAWPAIDAEFALNEGGSPVDSPNGRRVFLVQTAEKIPARVIVRVRGTAGHGSLPRPDNPVVRLARALVRLTDYDQPVRLNPTTRRYLGEVSKLSDYQWLAPLVPRLENPETALAAADQIRRRDPEIDALLRTTLSPTMLSAGTKINVIPNVAEARIDVRRLPGETREEVMARFRKAVNDATVEIVPAPGQEMPATEPSPLDTVLYRKMEDVLARSHPKSLVVPYMIRGATDGAFLRSKGMPVYGVPVFLHASPSRAHGNDERISLVSLDAGAKLLWRIVLAVCE